MDIKFLSWCLVLLAISFIRCTNNTHLKTRLDNKIIAYRMDYKLPIEIEESKFAKPPTWFVRYISDSIVVYKFPYNFDSLVDDKLVHRELRYDYLVYQMGTSEKGLMLNNKRDKFVEVHVDSILNEEAFNTLHQFGDKIGKEIIFFRSINDPSGTKRTDIYFSRAKKSEFDPDSFYMSYDKKSLNERYSLIKKLDTLDGMKLYNFRMTFSSYSEHDSTKKYAEMYFDMKPVEPEDLNVIQEIIDTYKKIL